MTQSKKILAHLKSKGSAGATALELTNLFVMQYNWCIKNLRSQGHVIDSRIGREENGKLRWRFFYRGQNVARLKGHEHHGHNHDGHGNVMVHTEEGKVKKGGVNPPPTPDQTAAYLAAGPPRGQGGYQPVGPKLNNPPQSGSGVPPQLPIRFTMEE